MTDDTKHEARSDLNDSIVAQMIEVGLAARYSNDFEGLTWARRKLREELIAKGWVLPPHTYETDDWFIAQSNGS